MIAVKDFKKQTATLVGAEGSSMNMYYNKMGLKLTMCQHFFRNWKRSLLYSENTRASEFAPFQLRFGILFLNCVQNVTFLWVF